MTRRALPLAIALGAFGALPAHAQALVQSAAEQLIRHCEDEWAASNVSNDSSRVEACLADDYIGVGSRGSVRTKADVIAPEPGGSDYVSDTVDYVHIRFFGTTAIAQGSESWVRRSAEPRQGRFVWIDTWLFRDGHWQIVASQDTPAPPLRPGTPK